MSDRILILTGQPNQFRYSICKKAKEEKRKKKEKKKHDQPVNLPEKSKGSITA